MGSVPPTTFAVKRIAIIGAGPCGLSAAKYLRAQNAFSQIVIFEQQDEVGGIWNYSPLAPETCTVPQEDPFVAPDEPLRPRSDAVPIFPSPMYERLHANIPGRLMTFTDQKFPDDAWVFPQRELIEEYLHKYGEDVRELVKFCYQVTRVTLNQQDGHDKWEIEATSTRGERGISDTFDAVVVANGHYSTPLIPEMKGAREFAEAYPGVIRHSKQYRTPRPFKDQKVVVVGNGPSGLDIALQINTECRKPGLISVRQPTSPERLAHIGCEEVAEIEEFLVDKKAVRFSDGRIETEIDAIIFCTGFLFSYHFLPSLQHKLITTGRGIHGLYKHLFHIQHPTLAFPGLNMKAVPWPLSEGQAAVFSAVWSNNLQLPAKEEMEAWSQNLEEAKGEALHVFGPLGDGHYINELHDWAKQAKFLGKEPPYWDDELMWERSIFVEAKLRFEQLGCKAKTLEDIGFHYTPKVVE
ncbi:Fc.00g051810.m01.CDS01 [Cosmosporella sp. VM-42]